VSDDDAIMLPPEADRAWLIDAVAELTRSQGFSQFVVAPIVEPTPQFFPDKWAGGDASLGRLVRRLLHYVGLDEVGVAVEIHREDARGGAAPAPPGSGGVWLDGVERKVVTVMAAGPTLRDPTNAVAATARAVAHAFRDLHHLGSKDGQDNERLIDVTSVYLGFGLLTTEASLRFFSTSAGGFRSNRSKFQLGSLGPVAMAYLLGIQAVARGLDKPARKRLASHLQPNQAGFFRAAVAELEPRREWLVEKLGLPAPDTWPPPPDLDELTAPLEDELEDAEPEERKDEDKGIVGLNEGKPVFRVERSMAGRLGKVIIMGTLMGGGLIARSIKGIEISMPKMIMGGLVLAALGMLIGRLFEDVRCSEPKCGAPLERDMTVCPRCGGTIVGAIKNPKERLAAEEALRRAEADGVPGSGSGSGSE
jgi:hypothetical protein